MLHLTAPCTCLAPDGAHVPLEFERGWCARCGHLLDPVAESAGEVDGWIKLEAAIERTRLEVHREAGDLAQDPNKYERWLRHHLAA